MSKINEKTIKLKEKNETYRQNDNSNEKINRCEYMTINIRNDAEEEMKSYEVNKQITKYEKIQRFVSNYCRATYTLKFRGENVEGMGWRPYKHTFLVDFLEDDNGAAKETLSVLTVIPLEKCKINLGDEQERIIFKEFIKQFIHPNIEPVLHIDIDLAQKYLIIVRKYYPNGSMKDIIYNNKNPKLSYQKKYSLYKRKPLDNLSAAMIGKQILESLKFMHEKGFYHMHIHSGNIIIDQETLTVKISDIENVFLNLPLKEEDEYLIATEDIKQGKMKLEDFDVVCFGRVFYEMLTSTEFGEKRANLEDFVSFPRPIARVLEKAFLVDNKDVCKKKSMKLEDEILREPLFLQKLT